MSFIITDDLIALTDSMITPRSEETGQPDENMLVLNDLDRCFHANDLTKNAYLLDINLGAVTSVAALVLEHVNFNQYMIGTCDDGVNYSYGSTLYSQYFDSQAAVDSWTEGDSIATAEVGGYSGTCVKVRENGATSAYIYRDYAVTPGNAYIIEVRHKDIDSTGKNPTIRVRDQATGLSIVDVTPKAAANWTRQGLYFVAPTGCTTIRMYLIHNTSIGAGDAYYFDSFFLKLATVGGVISQDDETGRYNIFADLSGIPFNNQYLRLYIPQSATAVGDYTDKWQIGSLCCLSSATALTQNMSYGYTERAEEPRKSIELSNLGSRETITGNLVRWSADVYFGNRTPANRTEMLALNRMAAPIVFYENLDNTANVRICRLDSTLEIVWSGYNRIEGSGLRYVEYV